MAEIIVKIEEGQIRGVEEESRRGKTIFRFLGVPYAEPPVGKLRFLTAVPVKPWSGIKNAVCEKPPCCQIEMDPVPLNPGDKIPEGSTVLESPIGKMYSNFFSGNEDCLYLNIHTPKLLKNEEKLFPVMVYIHGGGFVSGSNSSKRFGPDFLVERDVVFVSIGYRLGVLGFLNLGTPEVPGNAGLKDQVCALKWIKNNIKNFNGDPKNITVFGISAGAASAEYHLISPISKGLFEKAILQEGSCLNPWALTKNPERQTSKLLQKLNISATENVLEKLQSIDVEDLIKISSQCGDSEELDRGELFQFVPTIEKTFPNVESYLTEDPLKAYKNIDKNIPVICGFASNEGDFFKTYFESLNSDQLSNLLFLDGMHMGIEERMAKNIKQFVYLMSHEGDLGFFNKMTIGPNSKESGHGFDMLYLSENIYVVEDEVNKEDKKIRELFQKMWTDFSKYGDPTPHEGLKWEALSKDQQKIYNICSDCSMIENPLKN